MEKEKLFKEIEGVSEETRAKIKNLSAFSLPTNPSERGFAPEQIKQRFYMPIVGQAVSVLTELERVIAGVNRVLATQEALLSGQKLEDGTGLDDLVLIVDQGISLAEFAKQLSDVRRNAEEIFAASDAAEASKRGAEAAKEGAENARDDILSMRVSSIPVAWNEIPSVTKTEVGGVAHLTFALPMGRPFTIARTFSSKEEMLAGAADDGVESGQYVMIDTGSVADSDTATLWHKEGTEYRFVIDLSGASGVKPVRGVDYFTQEDMTFFDLHIDKRLGKVGAALDGIIALQNSLIGGEGV